MRFSLLILIFAFGNQLYAQTKQINGDYFIKSILENLAEELPEDFDLTDLEEKLMYFQKHPINLNHANIDDLKSLVFLSPLQINNLLSHIKTNGKLLDLIELQSIADFNLATVERLLPFVTLQPADLLEELPNRSVFSTASHDLVVRFSRILEKQKGFMPLTGSHYLGSPEKILFRYKYNLANRISASLILEKDAGEQFTDVKNLFMDYVSAHLAFYRFGFFKIVVIGSYSLQFGQGLTVWSGFSFGKAADVTSVAKNDAGLKPYTSANEYAYLNGIATTLSLSKQIEVTGFISSRKLDASLSLQKDGTQVLSTINETGLHRTATEIKNRNAINQHVYGTVLQYHGININLGAIAHHTVFNKEFITGTPSYKYYDFTGKQLTNFGFHYNYSFKNCYLFGEIAKDIAGGSALINGALISLSSKISTVIQHRDYHIRYHNFFSQAIAEGGKTANEKGFYAGVNINPSKKWNFSFYTDRFIFPWLKFRIDAPSSGHEMLGQLVYTPTKTFKAILRYKTETKQQNSEAAIYINYLDLVKKSNYRADVSWQSNKPFKFQNRIELAQYQKGDVPSELGWMAYQDVSYSPLSSKLTGNVRLAFFHTASYDTRLYAYEDDVLYNFNFGQYNGEGWRTYLNLKYKIAKKVDLWARYATFLYQNVKTIGSGLDEIQGNQKSEVKFQMRYQF